MSDDLYFTPVKAATNNSVAPNKTLVKSTNDSQPNCIFGDKNNNGIVDKADFDNEQFVQLAETQGWMGKTWNSVKDSVTNYLRHGTIDNTKTKTPDDMYYFSDKYSKGNTQQTTSTSTSTDYINGMKAGTTAITTNVPIDVEKDISTLQDAPVNAKANEVQTTSTSTSTDYINGMKAGTTTITTNIPIQGDGSKVYNEGKALYREIENTGTNLKGIASVGTQNNSSPSPTQTKQHSKNHQMSEKVKQAIMHAQEKSEHQWEHRGLVD